MRPFLNTTLDLNKNNVSMCMPEVRTDKLSKLKEYPTSPHSIIVCAHTTFSKKNKREWNEI